MQPHPPIDKNGVRIKPGDVVRVLGVPDLSGMSARGLAASLPVFKHLVGTRRRVVAFDDFGCAQLVFSIRRGRSKGMHAVVIEPHLLSVQGRGLTARPTRTRGKHRALGKHRSRTPGGRER